MTPHLSHSFHFSLHDNFPLVKHDTHVHTSSYCFAILYFVTFNFSKIILFVQIFKTSSSHFDAHRYVKFSILDVIQYSDTFMELSFSFLFFFSSSFFFSLLLIGRAVVIKSSKKIRASHFYRGATESRSKARFYREFSEDVFTFATHLYRKQREREKKKILTNASKEEVITRWSLAIESRVVEKFYQVPGIPVRDRFHVRYTIKV